MNPTVLFPAFKRCSLMRLTIDAKIGAEALVPPEWANRPVKKDAMLSPFADTSGILLDHQYCSHAMDPEKTTRPRPALL